MQLNAVLQGLGAPIRILNITPFSLINVLLFRHTYVIKWFGIQGVSSNTIRNKDLEGCKKELSWLNSTAYPEICLRKTIKTSQDKRPKFEVRTASARSKSVTLSITMFAKVFWHIIYKIILNFKLCPRGMFSE